MGDEHARTEGGAEAAGTQVEGNEVELAGTQGGRAEGLDGEGAAFAPEAADPETLLAKYRELEERLRQAEDRVLRIAADADNFKKRMDREKQEATRYANERFIGALLPVMDNLERALDHAENGRHPEGLTEGVRMTLKSFQDTLAKFGCTLIEAQGKVFDPNFHEAVYREETTANPSNTVLRELQRGYLLNGRVLRPAMVVVACAPNRNADSSQGDMCVEADASAKSHERIKVTPA
jgi:molecular chaperone GrpE